jgi:adenine-specific DNA-methyltransferase
MSRARRKEKLIELVWPSKAQLELEAAEGMAEGLQLVECVQPARVELQAGQASLPLEPVGAAEAESAASGPATPNMLIAGDNLLAMQALAAERAGTIELIYIDPPYATGLSYYSQTNTSGGTIERRAYRDNTKHGMSGYLDQMYVRLHWMHRLLSDEGKLFVHCDWRANSALRLLLDEIFGADCFRNEIIWRRAPNLGRQAASRQLGRVIDTIYVYSKTPAARFLGGVPKRRTLCVLDGKGKPKGSRWDEERASYYTTAPRGDYTDKSVEKLRKEGRIYESSSGTVYIKYFLTKGDDGRWYKEQPVDALWDDYEVRPLRHRPKAEDMGYDTQKPEGLLERIIGWATLPGDRVADFFCGSGTTVAVAEAMGRSWIGCDVGQTAIDTTRRRLLDLRVVEPETADSKKRAGRRAHAFEIHSMLRAERVRWAAQCALTAGEVGADARAVLEAFDAEWLEGRDGVAGKARVYVAPAVSAPSGEEIDAACARARAAGQDSLTALAWEWGKNDPATLRARMKKQHQIALIQRTIPLELIRRLGKRQQLRFAERPELVLELVVGENARRLSIRLTDLHCPDPPQFRQGKGGDAASSELSWSELIDSWMVDWSYGGNGFAPSWRSYRTRKDRELSLQTPVHDFSKQKVSNVQVKVLTVWGDEIVRTLRVEC